MSTMKKRDVLALGFMTFALFVGAGNIIFPPMIGLSSGQNVWIAAGGFLITAVGLPVITIIALAKVGGAMSSLTSPIGKVAGTILAVVCYLAVGPLFATPRTTTVSFAVGFAPFVENDSKALALFIYSFVYYCIVILISLYPTKLLDSVGHILAPVKIISLAILGIFAFFIIPEGGIGQSVKPYNSTPFAQGFVDGYLTMDTLGALVFGIVVVNAIRSRNIDSPALITRYATIASLIAGIGLSLVYISLFKLGNDSYGIANGATNGADILHAYVAYAFGGLGEIFLGILIGVACLVTAVGLTTACGTFFSELIGISYKSVVFIVAIFSFAISNIGLTQLIAISGPALEAIYPPCIVLVLLSFGRQFFKSPIVVFSPAIFVSFIFGIFVAMRACKLSLPQWYDSIPLAKENLAWLIPVIVVLIVSAIVDYAISKDK